VKKLNALEKCRLHHRTIMQASITLAKNTLNISINIYTIVYYTQYVWVLINHIAIKYLSIVFFTCGDGMKIFNTEEGDENAFHNI